MKESKRRGKKKKKKRKTHENKSPFRYRLLLETENIKAKKILNV